MKIYSHRQLFETTFDDAKYLQLGDLSFSDILEDKTAPELLNVRALVTATSSHWDSKTKAKASSGNTLQLDKRVSFYELVVASDQSIISAVWTRVAGRVSRKTNGGSIHCTMQLRFNQTNCSRRCFEAVVPNPFVTAYLSTLDNFTAARECSMMVVIF